MAQNPLKDMLRNTPNGLLLFLKLLMVLSKFSPILQRKIEQILSGINSAIIFIDDIKITGETDEVHLQRLKHLSERLRDYNLRRNKEKSFLMTDEIENCGYKIQNNDIHKTQRKAKVILNAPLSGNVTQIKAFPCIDSY